MSKRGERVSDDQVRQYIRNLAAKRGEGSDVSVEHLRKKWGIGYKRAKRLHDDELGVSEAPRTRTAPRRDASESVTDEQVIAFIHKCREEGRDISTNELRHELHIGYKRAVRLLTQGEKGVRPARSPRKRSSLAMLATDQGPDVVVHPHHEEPDPVVEALGDSTGVDELAALHQQHLQQHLHHLHHHHHHHHHQVQQPPPIKRVRRERVKMDGSVDGSEDKEDDGVVGLEEATKVLEGETLDEGRVETNGDGLLEFTDVVLNLPKGGGWEETLHGFEYKDK